MSAPVPNVFTARIQAPVSSGRLSLDELDSFADALEHEGETQLAQTLLQGSPMQLVLQSRQQEILDRLVFNNEVDMQGTPILDQKQSGRCWIFSTLNVLRVFVARKYNIHDLKLSQAYIFFFDHLSKSNTFLEQILEHADEELESRTMQFILQNSGVEDGGSFELALQLLEQFGVVPQDVYPETWNTAHTASMDALINTQLKDFALDLRDAYALAVKGGLSHDAAVEATRKLKGPMLKTIHRVMTETVGTPPRPRGEFTWEFRDADKKFRSVVSTPLKFFRDISGSFDITKNITLVNDPRNPYEQVYAPDGGGIVAGASRQPRYLNVEIDVLKRMTIQQIKANCPVWFGVDIEKADSANAGYMDSSIYDYKDVFGVEVKMTKAERLRVTDSSPCHAMVIVGVQLDDDGNPVRWKVENSWGPKDCLNGFLVMTDKFFEDFVYQIASPLAALPRRLAAKYLNDEAVILPLWDPMA